MMLQQGLILLLGALALAPRPVPPPAGAPDGSVDPVAIRLLRDRIDRLDGSVTGEAARLAGRVLEEAGALEGSDPREGAVLLFDCASRLQLRLRENRLARPLFERAATLYERIGDGEGAARAEWHLADCYLVERRDEMALRAIAAARAYFETAGDPRPLATLARQEGEALAALGRMREGLEALDRAVRLAGEAGDRRLEGGIRYSRGCLRAQEGLAREGLQDLERARDLLAARESEGDGADFREVELALARAHLEGGRCDEAFEEARRCVRFFREHPVRELLARSLNVLAVACKETGRLEEAGRAFREVIDIRRAQGDEIGRAFALANRASLSLMQNRSAEALRDQMEAGRIFEEHHDLPNLAQNDLSTGTTLRVLGCNDEAARRLRRGLAAARKLGLDPLAAYARIQLGFLALGRKDYDTALDAFARADRFYERIGNARIRSTIAAGRAMTLAEQGDREAALREFERAEAGLERPRDAYSLAALGVRKAYLLVALDRDRDAVALLDSAWSFFEAVGDESRLARIEALRGRIAYLYGRDDEALDRFASVADHVVRGLERGIQPLGEDPAIEYRSLFEDALDMTVRTLTAHDEPSPAQVAWAYRTAQVFHGLGMAALLAEACRPSAPGVGGDLAGRYESALARLRAAQGDRAGFLLDPSEPAGLEERRAVARGRAEAERRVREADEALARVLEEVRTADPAYAAAAYPRPAPLERVREAIPEDGALIEFIETSSSTVAFVVTKRSTSVRVLGPTEEIRAGVERDVEGLRRALRAEDHEAQGERLRSLGRRIADPVIAALDPTAPPRILLVAPDGEIARVPMEALLLEDPPRGSDPREWSYLLGRFAVAYVHSGTAFLVGGGAPRRAPSPAPRLLAMGAPTSRTGGGGAAPRLSAWLTSAGRGVRGAGAPLPFAAREVLDVAELFAAGDAERRAIDEAREGFAARLEAGEDPGGVSLSGARFRVHLGDRASEAALKRDPWLEGADVVLLACHGIADLTSPALSCLLLGSSGEGGGGHEDGLLSLRELRDLHARCDLMILSACASKAGVLRPYEGTAGLAAAALAGGAETVLCTLWEVRDRSAARLVADFCRRRIAAGRTAADALAGAKRAALREGMPLGTWAAYTVWGAGACR